MKKPSMKKRTLFWVLNGLLLGLALLCFGGMVLLSRTQPAQWTAERWQGEGETEFAQISCFLPVDEGLEESQVYRFRGEIVNKLHEAALDQDSDQVLFVDAWSGTGKVLASSPGGKGEAKVIAVGGSFFQFHPIRLLSGSYLRESDLMKDRVLLDEDLAWLLFGGTDLEGMELKLNGKPFVVGGVIRREQDRANQMAYTAGMGLYMPFESYTQLDENARIGSYELCMAEPVEGYALNFMREKFPIGQGEIVENSGRYDFSRLLGLVRQYGKRSMQTLGVVYPYWENAARYLEDWCALLCFLGILLALIPAVTVLMLSWRLLKKGKTVLSEKLLPKAGEGISEAIRKRQRRAWEKRHPGED